MDDDAIRLNCVSKLRLINQHYGIFGIIATIGTIVLLCARFCIVHYAIQGNEFRGQDVLQIINFLIGCTSTWFQFLAAALPLIVLYNLLMTQRGLVVSPLSIIVALHYQTVVLFTLVIMTILAICIIQDTAIWLIHGIWCASLIGCIVIAELVFEHRGDFSFIEHKQGPVYKFAIGHAIFEIAVLLGLIFYGEHILDTPSGRRALIGTDPSPHFTVVFNVFTLMTLFAWFNARAACMGYSKKLLISPIFWTALSACIVMQVLFVQFGHSHLWVHPLTNWQWTVSSGVAALVLVWGVIVNGIPPKPMPSTTTSIPYQAVVKE